MPTYRRRRDATTRHHARSERDHSSPLSKATPHLSQLYSSRDLRAILGNCSDMTLWRYRKSAGLPAPIKLAGGRYGRNFWRREAIDAWLASRAAATA